MIMIQQFFMSFILVVLSIILQMLSLITIHLLCNMRYLWCNLMRIKLDIWDSMLYDICFMSIYIIWNKKYMLYQVYIWYEMLMIRYMLHTRYMIIYVRCMISNVYDILNYPVGLNRALYIRYITNMMCI